MADIALSKELVVGLVLGVVSSVIAAMLVQPLLERGGKRTQRWLATMNTRSERRVFNRIARRDTVQSMSVANYAAFGALCGVVSLSTTNYRWLLFAVSLTCMGMALKWYGSELFIYHRVLDFDRIKSAVGPYADAREIAELESRFVAIENRAHYRGVMVDIAQLLADRASHLVVRTVPGDVISEMNTRNIQKAFEEVLPVLRNPK